MIGKPMGRYITVEAVHLPDGNDDYQQAVTGVLCRQLQKLLPDLKDKKILVAGIGNREITPDALGPLVVEHLFITRHLFEKYGRDSVVVKDMGNVCAVIPGVMSQTGMETAEILHGLVREVHPDLLNCGGCTGSEKYTKTGNHHSADRYRDSSRSRHRQ